MPPVVVLAEDDLAVAARDGDSKRVTITAAFEDRSRNSQIRDFARSRLEAEHLRHLVAAEAKQAPVERDRHGANMRQRRLSQHSAEALAFGKGVDLSIGAGGIKQIIRGVGG